MSTRPVLALTLAALGFALTACGPRSAPAASATPPPRPSRAVASATQSAANSTQAPPTRYPLVEPTATQGSVFMPAIGASGATATPTLPPPPPTATPLPPSPTPAVISAGPFTLAGTVASLVPGTGPRLVATDDGSLWLLTTQAVARWQAGTWRTYLRRFTDTPIGVDGAGRVWFVGSAGPTAGMARAYNGARWVDYGEPAGWIPLSSLPAPQALTTDLSSNVWLATGADLRRFDGRAWTVVPLADAGLAAAAAGEATPAVTLLPARSTQDLWVGVCDWAATGQVGGGGVRAFDGRAWRGGEWPVASGCASALADGGFGRVWASVGGALWRYEPARAQWQSVDLPSLPGEAQRFGYAQSLHVDRAGRLWAQLVPCDAAGCLGPALYRLDGAGWLQFAPPAAGSQQLLFAGEQPWLVGPTTVHRVTEAGPEAVAELPVLDAALAPDGSLWLLADSGGQPALWVLANPAGATPP